MPSGVVEAVRPVETALPKAESKDSPPVTKDAKDITTTKTTKKNDEGAKGKPSSDQGEGEGVEVVLNERGTTKVVEENPKTGRSSDQNVFRHPQAVRPRAMRAPGGPPPQPFLHGSGSWGYGPHHLPPPHRDYPHPRPYPVPPYGSSASFDDPAFHHTPHYSPHIQYPPPGGRIAEDVNVISPNHKSDPHYRPNLTPRPRAMPPPQGYYQYPPTSPVSRTGRSPTSGPPRVRNYAMNRSDGPYAKAQRGNHPDDGTWNAHSPPRSSPTGSTGRRQPPLVTESSFDSENRSTRSHPPTPSGPAMPPPMNDPSQFYGGGSWGSFDSAAGPPPHFDDYRYYNAPPESPYSSYMPPYSPGGIYPAESFPPPAYYGPTGSFSYSYDEEDRFLKDYHPEGERSPKQITPPGKHRSRSRTGTPVASNKSNSMLLPKAAEEIDFEVTDPPLEPILPPSDSPACESLADVNNYDVLCGRGGGTNSQIGNRRFRKLVQEFQPTYLLARRKEKPLLARTIVLIIRKRGGRFLKKEEDSGALFEVGDAKAEAKTSQALREGLDVRATKSAATSLVDKKKKPKGKGKGMPDTPSPSGSKVRKAGTSPKREPGAPGSPPALPKLAVEQSTGSVPPPSPIDQSHMHTRKRRRIPGGGNFASDRFFPDFCPPRADLGRPSSPPATAQEGAAAAANVSTTPIRRNSTREDDDDDIREFDETAQPVGCTNIALDMVTGAAAGSFCLGPSGWRR